MVIRNERRVLLVFDAKEAKMLRMDCILQTNVKEEVEPSLGTSDSCQYEIESREEAQFMQEVKDEFEIKVEDEFLGFSDEPFFPNQQESPDKQDTIRTREEGQFMQEVKEEFEIKVEDEVMGLPDEPFFPNQQESTGKQDTIRTSGSAVMASQGMREVEMSLVEAVRDHPTLQDSQNEKHKLRRHHKSQFISVGESMNSLDPQLGMFTAGGGPATNDLSKIAKVIGTRNSCVLGIEGRIDTNQDKPIQERDPPTLQSNSPDVITVGPTAEEEPSVVTAQPTMVAQQVGDLQPPAADQQAADLQQPALLRNVSNAPVKCLSVQDAIDLLYSEEFNVDDDAEVIDLVNIPPDDDLSDEDEVDDDNPLIPMVKDVPGAIEIHTTQAESEKSGEGMKKRRRLNSVDTPVWRHMIPQYSKWGEMSNQTEKLKAKLHKQLDGHTPVDIFEDIFTDDIFALIKRETIRYAHTVKNDPLFSLEEHELKAFIGFLIYSGYVSLPNERLYWSDADDVGQNIVKQALSRNKYLKIKAYLHVQDNNSRPRDCADKGFKVRPLIDMLNSSFKQYGVFHKNLTVDEMMVKYYGHYGLKQFIRGKPIRFGYKLWSLCGDEGYCYKFDLYCGRENHPALQEMTLGTRVVLDMCSVIDETNSHCIFFDNLFTSRDLLTILAEKNMRATGTVRENRLQQCPIKDSKVMTKEERGSYDYRFDKKEEILVVKWNDNKVVSVMTNYDSVDPLTTAQRYDRRKKKRIDIVQPKLIKTYNKGMRGVDLHDWLIGKYSIAIRGKKWYWCLLTRMIDMTIINSWLLHRLVSDEPMTLLEFHREIAVSYLKAAAVNREKPRFTSSLGLLTPLSLRYDGVQHFIARIGDSKRLRCQLVGCDKRPTTKCVKCDVALCMECFANFHTRT